VVGKEVPFISADLSSCLPREDLEAVSVNITLLALGSFSSFLQVSLLA
jgi:hypothetical protein